jgi:hypothetical protein
LYWVLSGSRGNSVMGCHKKVLSGRKEECSKVKL